MTQLVRWEPFDRDFDALRGMLHRVFSPSPSAMGDDDLMTNWSPAVDIFDNGDPISIQAELPGMRREDIHVNLENNVLTLKGERLRERKLENQNAFRSERSFGGFSRSFTLPGNVSVDRIGASYEAGILTVTLPKTEEARPRQIDITVK